MIEKYKKTKNANIPEDFESLLIKEESSIRNYIAVNNRLELENNNLKDKIRILEEDQKNLEEKINKIKEKYENKIKEMNDEIKDLNINKNRIEKNFVKKLDIKQKEIERLQMKLNNILKNGLKNIEEKKDSNLLLENVFKKSNSTDFGIKFRINYSDLDIFQKNTNKNSSMIHPHSARNLNNINDISDYKQLNNNFPEGNNIFNEIHQNYISLLKKENSFFNGFFGKNKNIKSQHIDENASSIFRKIRKNFIFADNIKFNSYNDIKLKKDGMKNKENKILLLPRSNNNKIKRNFSAIYRKGKNEDFFYLLKNENDNFISKNINQDNFNSNLINQTQNKISNNNSILDVNKEKKNFKMINKFRISFKNKNEINLNKEDKNKLMIFPKKILENKIIEKENNINNVTNNKYKGISINYNIPTN